MLKTFFAKIKYLAVALVLTLAGFFTGSSTTSPTDYTLTVLDGDCIATTTPGSAIFYTLLGVAALPSSNIRVEVVIDQMATFKFHPCEAISINKLLTMARSQPSSDEWTFDIETQTAYNVNTRVRLPVSLAPSVLNTDLAFSPSNVDPPKEIYNK